MKKNSNLWISITSILALISVAGLIIYGLSVYERFRAVDIMWRTYNAQAASVNQSILELKSAVGYGGLIHNFKNYVLRNRVEYARWMAKDIEKISQAFKKLEPALTSNEEQADLRTIRFTFDQYIKNIGVAHELIQKGYSIREIDEIVKVDDAPALAAFQRLEEAQVRKSSENEKATQNALDKARFFLLNGSVIVIIVLGMTIAIIILLRHSRQLYDLEDRRNKDLNDIFDNAPDAMIRVRTNGIIDRVNNQCISLFGYSREELIGMSVEQLIPTQYRHHHVDLRDAYFKAPSFRSMAASARVRGLTKTGEQPVLQISLSTTTHGDNVKVSASIRDITESEKMEKRLRIAQQKVREASDAKARMLSNMSHELRTPLNHIIGFAQLLLNRHGETPLSSQRSHLQLILQAGERQLKLIESILELSDMDMVHASDAEPFDPVVMIDNIIFEHGEKAREKGIQIEFESRDTLTHNSWSNPNLLHRVINELIENAIKFMDKSDGLITISARAHSDHLILSICDNGPGIPGDKTETAFVAFERLEAQEGVIDGIGIGLTLSRQIINSIGGRIWIESPNSGTCVYIRIPVLRQGQDND